MSSSFPHSGHQSSIIAVLAFFSISGHADGLADLKAALKRLQTDTSITASLHSAFEQTREEDEPKRTGDVRVRLTHDINGLHVTYDQKVLDKMEAERNLKQQQEDADTPTLNAMERLEASELQSYFSAASQIERVINKARFLDENPVLKEGRALRLLRFALPLESVIDNKKTRQYVSDFEASYKVYIDEQGTPLEIHSDYHGKGRAYIVISVEAYGSQTEQFSVVNKRLISLSSHSKSGWRSTFGDGETISSRKLEVFQASDHGLAQQVLQP